MKILKKDVSLESFSGCWMFSSMGYCILRVTSLIYLLEVLPAYCRQVGTSYRNQYHWDFFTLDYSSQTYNSVKLLFKLYMLELSILPNTVIVNSPQNPQSFPCEPAIPSRETYNNFYFSSAFFFIRVLQSYSNSRR